jgi:DNA (cytosine-5)-methyltransferase 1
VGNAVPVGLGRAVGKAIIDHLSSQVPQKDPTFDDFPYSRYKNTNDSSWRLDFKKSTSMPKSQQLNLSITSD